MLVKSARTVYDELYLEILVDAGLIPYA